MTKKQKLESFDSVKADADKLALAVHDLVNGKFSPPVRINVNDFDPDYSGGFYSMRVSMRAMPLYLVWYVVSAQAGQVRIYTDNEIMDIYRDHPLSVETRMLMYGRNDLVGKHACLQSAQWRKLRNV